MHRPYEYTTYEDMTDNEKFSYAVKNQMLNEVESLLRSGIPGDACIKDESNNYIPALAYAKQVKNESLCALLIAYGADAKRKETNGKTNLQKPESYSGVVKQQDAVEATRKLIDAVASNNIAKAKEIIGNVKTTLIVIDQDNNTLMHHVCFLNNAEMAKLLLSIPNVMIHSKNKQGQTPLHLAVSSRNNEVLAALEKHPKFEQVITEIFKQAVAVADVGTLEYLVGRFDFLECDKTALAISCKNFESFILSVHSNNLKPEHITQAIASDDPRFIDYIIKYQGNNFRIVDPITNENRLLSMARKGKWEAVQAYVREHPTHKLDPYGYTYLLLEAITCRHEEAVRTLLAANTPISCLYARGAWQILENLGKNRNEVIIELLKSAAVSDPGILKHLKARLGYMPEHLRNYFTDELDPGLFREPVITPSGGTYEKAVLTKWLQQKKSDPKTRESLEGVSIYENLDVIALKEYYWQNGDAQQGRMPLLLNSSGEYFREPVVAKNGHTYERSELLAYLASHHNQLPPSSPGEAHTIQEPSKLYPNLLFKALISEIYLKREFIQHLQGGNISALETMLQSGFSINSKLDSDNNNVAHFAIQVKSRALLDFCFRNNADFLTANKQRQSALQLAMRTRSEHFFAVLDHLAKQPAVLRQIFSTAVKDSELETIAIMLDRYAPLLNNFLPQIIEKLITDNNYRVLETLMPQLQDNDLLLQLDAMLPAVIESKQTPIIRAFLKSKITMQSLMSKVGTDALKSLLPANDMDRSLKELLLVESSKRHKAIAFRVKEILYPSITVEKEVSEELDDLLTDPVNYEPFENAHITPTGQSFSLASIAGKSENPISRAPLSSDDLRPNLLLLDVVRFVKLAESKEDDVPPMLYSLSTGKLMTEPMVGKNGRTYDKAELEAYKSSHEGRLPDNQVAAPYPDLVMTSLCEHYSKKQKASPVSPVANGHLGKAMAEHGLFSRLEAPAAVAPDQQQVVKQHMAPRTT